MVRKYLTENQIQPRKKWGQNFFVESKQLQRLVANLNWQGIQQAVEVGPGFGALTEVALASSREQAIPFDLVEIDPVLFAYLVHNYNQESRVRLYQEDFLAEGAQYRKSIECKGRVALLGNIPYNITSAVAQEFLANGSYVWTFLLVQREVGEAWLFGWGQNRLASLLQLHGTVTKLGDIQPQSFYPQPKVASMTLFIQKDFSFVREIVRKNNWTVSIDEMLSVAEELFRVLFWGRKKSLKTLLKNNPYRSLTAKEVDSVLAEADLDGQLRINAVGKEAFLRLAYFWSQSIKK